MASLNALDVIRRLTLPKAEQWLHSGESGPCPRDAYKFFRADQTRQSLWHVDCFRCAKCKDRVSADTNLLLLSDGSPVCGNCSYQASLLTMLMYKRDADQQCFVCKQAITEEAIMTGDESYHAHCFTCRTCKRRIEELVFAKTSQGIYCMVSD